MHVNISTNYILPLVNTCSITSKHLYQSYSITSEYLYQYATQTTDKTEKMEEPEAAVKNDLSKESFMSAMKSAGEIIDINLCTPV